MTLAEPMSAREYFLNGVKLTLSGFEQSILGTIIDWFFAVADAYTDAMIKGLKKLITVIQKGTCYVTRYLRRNCCRS